MKKLKLLIVKKIQKEAVIINQLNALHIILWDQLDQYINGFFEKVKLQDLTRNN